MKSLALKTPKKATKQTLRETFKDAEWASTVISNSGNDDEKIRLKYIRLAGKVHVYCSLPGEYPSFHLVDTLICQPESALQNVIDETITPYERKFIPTQTVTTAHKPPPNATKGELMTAFAGCARNSSTIYNDVFEDGQKKLKYFQIGDDLFVYLLTDKDVQSYVLFDILSCKRDDTMQHIVQTVIDPYEDSIVGLL